MAKTIAIVFSDLHLGDYAKFNQNNQRTLNHFKVLFKIQKLCKKYQCPAIFAGDLFHKPEMMTNDFFRTLVTQFNLLNQDDWELYTLSGNHDLQKVNHMNNLSPSWVGSLCTVYKFMKPLDFETYNLDKFTLSGVPYIDNNIGLNLAINERVRSATDKTKPHILILHSDFPGAKDTDGTEVGEVENLNINLLKPFKLVLMGHIHKPQKLGKKVYMVGAPLQQRRTDKNCDGLGYWKIKDDFSIQFVNWMDSFPKFIDVASEEEEKDDGNYYTIIAQKSNSNEDPNYNHGVSVNISKTRMVKKYLKAIGVKDKKKKEVLTSIIKEADNDI